MIKDYGFVFWTIVPTFIGSCRGSFFGVLFGSQDIFWLFVSCSFFIGIFVYKDVNSLIVTLGILSENKEDLEDQELGGMSEKTNVNYWVVLYELIRVQVITVFYFGLIYFSFVLFSERGQEFEGLSDLFSLIIIVVFSAIIAIPIFFNCISFFYYGFFVSVYLIEKRVKALCVWVAVSTLIGII